MVTVSNPFRSPTQYEEVKTFLGQGIYSLTLPQFEVQNILGLWVFDLSLI